MKIAIIGTHSTGKTTLKEHIGNELAATGHSVAHLPEFARLCPFPINQTTTLEAQTWILEQQMLHEYIAHQPGVFLLCDRATIDNFAYMHRATNGKDINGYENLAVDHMQTYDYVFKTTMLDIDPLYDKVRSTDGTFRQDIDNRITHFLHKHNIFHYALPATTDLHKHTEYIFGIIKHAIPNMYQQAQSYA